MQPFASRFSSNPRCHDLGSFRFVGPRPPCDVWNNRWSKNGDVLACPSRGWSGTSHVECLDHISSDTCAYIVWHEHDLALVVFRWSGTCMSHFLVVLANAGSRLLMNSALILWSFLDFRASHSCASWVSCLPTPYSAYRIVHVARMARRGQTFGI